MWVKTWSIWRGKLRLDFNEGMSMTTQGGQPRRPAHSALIWLWLSAVVVVLDQVSKYIVVTQMKLAETVTVLPWLNWHLAYNTGAAISILGRVGGSQVIL